ncbi:phosphinothricin acetyltransferase [Microbacterium sp. cf046]|uniref:GNAT family N-acetyltransferase n=1 Tax=Microbacterium sp. cf046 TaxID=1761803 RepID=UPI0008E75BC7|nr:GNAT family N-acetyltransferase [Microbacterium sp. cf046]SFR92490.1 phosphinothricin acetyltransferase [Microbacterium sp. cf046]
MLLVTGIRAMTPADWPAVEEIYRQGIEEGEATFESETPGWDAFDASRLPEPRLVAIESHATVLGWAAAAPVSTRVAYDGVIEHSVYVHRDARGRGVGRALLDAFVTAADRAGYWTIQSSIFPENAASLRVHESAGFRVIGTRERIARSARGAHAGRWRDTVLIERRSAVNGRDEETP